MDASKPTVHIESACANEHRGDEAAALDAFMISCHLHGIVLKKLDDNV